MEFARELTIRRFQKENYDPIIRSYLLESFRYLSIKDEVYRSQLEKSIRRNELLYWRAMPLVLIPLCVVILFRWIVFIFSLDKHNLKRLLIFETLIILSVILMIFLQSELIKKFDVSNVWLSLINKEPSQQSKDIWHQFIFARTFMKKKYPLLGIKKIYLTNRSEDPQIRGHSLPVWLEGYGEWKLMTLEFFISVKYSEVKPVNEKITELLKMDTIEYPLDQIMKLWISNTIEQELNLSELEDWIQTNFPEAS